MSIPLDELIRYWQGELSPEREAQVEEIVFEDAATARRLDAIAQLDGAVRAIVAAGQLQGSLTVKAVEAMQRSGLHLRTYRVDAGQTVPCTIALEDLVVIRLRGDFEEVDTVDVVMSGTFEGLPPATERYDDVAIDRRTNEIVLVYPGDRIRALPRSQFRYTVTSGDRHLGDFSLDHTPPA